MKNTEFTGRKSWVDVLKGLLILFVILGHITTNPNILNWLGSFYMPCFFIISGWLMKKDASLNEVIRKKIRGVLLPYFIFALIWVLFCFAKNFVVKSNFNFFRALLSIVLPYSGAPFVTTYNLWFFPCLFLSQILVAIFIYKNIIYKIMISAVWIVFLVLGIFITPYCSLLYAVAIASIFVGLGFFISNYLYAKIKIESKFLLRLLIVFICLLVHVSCLILNVYVFNNNLDFSSASYGILPIYLLGAFAGSMFFIGLNIMVKKFILLEYVGKNSMVYYALHYEVLAIVDFIVVKFINVDWLMSTIIFISTISLTTAVVFIYNKLKIGKLFK